MQPELQKLAWRWRAVLGERERINRKAGRREDQQGSESAFLLLGDQNQKYFPGSEQKIQAHEPNRVVAHAGGAQSANP